MIVILLYLRYKLSDMENLITNIKIQVNPKTYVKDPETTSLGKNIIQHSIILIDEIGFEEFTFKKLGEKIGSNESSIYRYFENKHKLLVYLTSWYWAWIEYRLVFSTANIENKIEKLKKAITIVTETIQDDNSTEHVNEEFTKTLYNKQVDQENKEGFFLIYKQVNYRIEKMVEEVNPDYPFAKSLVSSIIEGSLHQHFLRNHLKTITNCNSEVSPSSFYIHLIENLLKK